MSEKALLPAFLIEGLPYCGATTLATFIANTYNLELFDGNDILTQVYLSTLVSPPTTPAERIVTYTSFLRDVLSGKPEVIFQLFTFISQKMSQATRPVVISFTGTITYSIAKQMNPLFSLWIHCDETERARRLHTKHSLPVDDNALKQTAILLSNQDAAYTNVFQRSTNISPIPETNMLQVAFVNSTGITPEQLLQKVSTMEQFTAAYNKVSQQLPEIEQEWRRWKCMVCNYVYEGNQNLTTCPRCKNSDPDKFTDPD